MKPTTTMFLAALLAIGTACGYSSKATTPPTAGTMPNITALAPTSTPAGSTGVVLTVNGTNFNANATINLSGTAATTTHVSGSQLMATIPNADVATAGTISVTVTNPGMTGGIYGGGTTSVTSNAMTFTIN